MEGGGGGGVGVREGGGGGWGGGGACGCAERGSGVMGFQNKSDPEKSIPSELVFY